MKAVILAAGEGTRLRPYTDNKPKCMVEINGVSMIERQIKVLKSLGIEEIIIIGGYKSEMLQNKSTNLILNERYYETNMVWTLFCGENYVNGDLIVSYGDIVYSPESLKNVLDSKADISVAVDKNWEKYWRERNNDPLDDAETLKLDEFGFIKEIGQVPHSIEEIEGQYMGLMKFNENGTSILRSTFQKGKMNSSICGKLPEKAYMTDLLMNIINDGHKVMSVPVYEPWIEIDTSHDLEALYTRDRIKLIDEKI